MSGSGKGVPGIHDSRDGGDLSSVAQAQYVKVYGVPQNVGRETRRQTLSGGISLVVEGPRRSWKNGQEENEARSILASARS